MVSGYTFGGNGTLGGLFLRASSNNNVNLTDGEQN
jgi:hypothetical protein